MIVQGSDEWRQARLGKLTASRVADALARTKSGWGASRKTYRTQLVLERRTGIAAEGYTNRAMQWGTDTEPRARAVYALETLEDVVEVGFVDHPTIPMSGCSPDGLVGADGLVELKCPESHTHLEYILGIEPIPAKYLAQMQWQMACTGRKWCDYVSFDPRMRDDEQYEVERIMRNDAIIEEMEKQVREFLAEVDEHMRMLDERAQKRLQKAA